MGQHKTAKQVYVVTSQREREDIPDLQGEKDIVAETGYADTSPNLNGLHMVYQSN